MNSVTLKSHDVCPKMVDIFNALMHVIDGDDPNDVMAVVAFGRILAEEITDEPEIFWDSSGPFSDVFMRAVTETYGSEE